MSKQSMSKQLLFMALVLFARAQHSIATEAPCAVIEKFGRATQLIPKTGAVVSKFDAQGPVACGSMVITHGDGFWIRFANQVLVKIAPNSFLEIGSAPAESHRLYRGDLMVSGPAGSGKMVFATPNGEVHYDGGVFTVKYQNQDRTTSVACFNQSVEFNNKFNSKASQKVNVGEISRLTIHDIRVVPTQPVAMSPSSVKDGIQIFELDKSEQEQFVELVSRVFEQRAKSLVSDLENFKDIPEGSEEDRSPASLKRYQPAIDPNEQELTMKILRRRLYEDDPEIAKPQRARKPASEPRVDIVDTKKELNDAKKKKETERVMKEISNLDTAE